MAALQIPVTKVSESRASLPASASARKMAMLKRLVCSDKHERALRAQGFVSIAGVDEVGRGCIFGPVVAAAVVLPEKTLRLRRLGLRDSKQLTRETREELDGEIRSMAIAIGIAEIDSETIDRINIYQASRLAMLRAVEALNSVVDHLLIDAMRIDHPCPQTKLIYGDSLSLSIAAASVVAKVYRDTMMREYDMLYPQYGLASHKGYGTAQHRRAIQEHGICDQHRRTFAPVAAVIGEPPQETLFPFEDDVWEPED